MKQQASWAVPEAGPFAGSGDTPCESFETHAEGKKRQHNRLLLI
jgi:hypothetical protein